MNPQEGDMKYLRQNQRFVVTNAFIYMLNERGISASVIDQIKASLTN